MKFLTYQRLAYVNILSAKLRSVLAVLGVLVGTASIVALMSASELATSHALQQFKQLGTRLMVANLQTQPNFDESQQSGLARSLDQAEIWRLQSQIPSVDRIAPFTSLFQPILINGKAADGGAVLAVGQYFADLAKIHVESGRFISVLDHDQNFCVVGSSLANVFRQQGLSPLGQQIQIGSTLLTIVGIAAPWTPSILMYVDINHSVIIPLSLAKLLDHKASINTLIISMKSGKPLSLGQRQLTRQLSILQPDKIVRYRTPAQIIQLVQKQRQTFTWLLGAIGGIALLVGGIGVMNIMLATVAERRREIGIRLAVGAKASDIRNMFLTESVMMSIFGGSLGVSLGVLMAYVLSIVTHWGFHLYIMPMVLGFAVSFFVGVISGYYPAARASRLQPMQCLQSE